MGDINCYKKAFLHGKKKIYKAPVQTLAFSSTSTTASFTVEGNAFLHSAVVNIPNFTNAVTTILSIKNSADEEIYASSSLARNTVHKITAQDEVVAIDGLYTITATLSGEAGGSGGNITITMNFERD